MKLFEDMKELGGTINDVIQKIINDMFREELDDDAVTDIVNKLSLSDLLALDDAYTSGDKERVQDILGPMPQMEYSMGGANRQVSSVASERPTPKAAGSQAGAKKGGAGDSTQTTRNYSGGVQNGVSTTNVDDETPNDPNTVMQDDEPIEEGKSTDAPDGWAIIGIDRYGNEKRLSVEDPHKKQHAEEVIAKSLMGMKAGTSRGGLLQGYVDARIEPYYEEPIEESPVGAPDYNPARGGYDQADLEQLAQEYQATMAGMGRRDEQDIIDDMYAIANPDTVDDILNGMDVDVPQMEVTENTEKFNSEEIIRALLQTADDEELSSLELLANRVHQSFPDSVTLADIMSMLNEPQLRDVRRDDVEYALHAGGFLDMMESKAPKTAKQCGKCGENSIVHTKKGWYCQHCDKKPTDTNIVEMTAWLKRRAGIN